MAGCHMAKASESVMFAVSRPDGPSRAEKKCVRGFIMLEDSIRGHLLAWVHRVGHVVQANIAYIMTPSFDGVLMWSSISSPVKWA